MSLIGNKLDPPIQIVTGGTGETDPQPLDNRDGIRITSSRPQPRLDVRRRPPELKKIYESAPVEVGTSKVSRRSKTDPESPLEGLRKTLLGECKGNDKLFVRCWEAVLEIQGGYSLMKSPPEYKLGGHVDALTEKAMSLAQLVNGFDGGGEVEAQIRTLLEGAINDLTSHAVGLSELGHPLPSMSTVGHFKSLETQAAIEIVNEELARKAQDLEKCQPGSDDWQLCKRQLEVLEVTKLDLEHRRDTFDGKHEGEWTIGEPIDVELLKKLMGQDTKTTSNSLKKLVKCSVELEIKGLSRDLEKRKMPPMTSSKASETVLMALLLRQRLSEAGVEVHFSELKERIDHKHVEVLGKGQNWDKIEKKVGLTIGGEPRVFTSTLTPHNKLIGAPPELQDGEGVCCHDGTSGIAVNVWKSELKDDRGNLLFSQVRTGVNCAYEIKDDEERSKVNFGRSKQILETHLNNDPKLRARLLEQVRARESGSTVEPIVVRNVWVSHLTPDPFRGLGGMTSSSEDLMVLEQDRAMHEVGDFCETNDIMIRDDEGNEKPVKVRYQPIMFNFGVNQGSVTLLAPVLGGWGWVNEQFNAPSMQFLLGEEGSKGGQIGGWVSDGIDGNQARIDEAQREIARLSESIRQLDELREVGGGEVGDGGDLLALIKAQQDIIVQALASNERIRALAGQVQELWRSKDYKSSGEDPYKMGSRIALLAFEIGVAVTSNCKSNKDRNSYGDVHMKDLSIGLRERGRLRGPDEPRSREEQLNLRTMSRECGNSELQTLNVGGAGYKLDGVVKIYDEQGLKDMDLGFLGFGPYTRV